MGISLCKEINFWKSTKTGWYGSSYYNPLENCELVTKDDETPLNIPNLACIYTSFLDHFCYSCFFWVSLILFWFWKKTSKLSWKNSKHKNFLFFGSAKHYVCLSTLKKATWKNFFCLNGPSAVSITPNGWLKHFLCPSW